MSDQSKIKPLSGDEFLASAGLSRLPPEHTVSIDAALTVEPATWQKPTTDTRFPFPITRADLDRGSQQFAIYCAPCHGILGDGDGMVPERGFTRPPSYHTDRLRNAPPSYFYNVMTLGVGAMFPVGRRIDSDDRWRIAAYIRALQLAQNPSAASSSAATATSPATQEGVR
jgi:cytochrome c